MRITNSLILAGGLLAVVSLFSAACSAADPASATFQVPLGAILDEGKGPAVWVVKGQQVTRQTVAITRMEDDKAHVTGALQPSDTIVALGAHLLSEGTQVRIATQAASASASKGAIRE